MLSFVCLFLFVFGLSSRCVSNVRPLLESGTMGAKGHVQVCVCIHVCPGIYVCVFVCVHILFVSVTGVFLLSVNLFR